MAGEVVGKIYEAITKVALELALKGNKKGLKVFWHEKPDWISIEPDLTVGKNKDNIEALYLITHTKSECNSNKKFWRNEGEHFQWKIQGKNPVRCFDVVFESLIKPNIIMISESIMDSVLTVPHKEYGKYLIKFVNKNKGFWGNDDDARYNKLLGLLNPHKKSYNIDFKNAIHGFSKDLKTITGKENKPIKPLWKLLRMVDKPNVISRGVKKTYVRNGITKLLLFNSPLRNLVYNFILNKSEIKIESIPDYLFDLQKYGNERFFDFGISGVDRIAEDIRNVIELLGKEICENVVTSIPEKMENVIKPIRGISNIDVYIDFLIDNYKELKNPKGMLNLLNKCYDDPVSLIKDTSKIQEKPNDNWLFVCCMTLDVVKENKIFAYGLSTLADETGFPEISTSGFIIPPYIWRRKNLNSEMLKAIAKVFANKIKNLGVYELFDSEFRAGLKKMMIIRQLHKLLLFDDFNALAFLIENKLRNVRLPYSIEAIPTCFSEYVGVKAATTKFIRVGEDALICWKTVTEAGRIHKTKELSARFRATKVMWDGRNFVKRPNAKRMLFVADGEWREEDFKMLLRSGIDGIFYPDEMDKLIKAIK